MTTYWTPAELSILLHCHYAGERYEPFKAPTTQKALTRLEHEGLIEKDTLPKPAQPEDARPFNTHRTTSKGKAFVAMLCSTPIPEEQTKWADPRTGEPV